MIGVFILWLVIYPIAVYAESSIIINEFLIDPLPQQVELLNIGSDQVDISHWYIDDSGGTTFFTIPENTILTPNSCLVFASDFNFNKSSSDAIRLFDSAAQPTNTQSHIIESFNYDKSPGTGITFQKIENSTQFATGTANLGKYNQSQKDCIVTPTPTLTLPPTFSLLPEHTPSLTQSASPQQAVTDLPHQTYDNIYITEAMVYPDSDQHEWVELYNNNNFDVNLESWYIDDTANSGSTPIKFSLSIKNHAYGVYELKSSMFNNDGDSVRLLDPMQNLKDSFEYNTTSQKGKSWGRTSLESDIFCIQTSSYGLENTSCLYPTQANTASSTPTLYQQITPLSPTLHLTHQITITNTYPNKHILVDITERPAPIFATASSGAVLGTKTKQVNTTTSLIINLLCFIGFSYCVIAAVSILYKIKKHM